MHNANLGDKPMLLMALGTIRAETASFEPISEGRSRLNTSPTAIRSISMTIGEISATAARRTGNSFKGRGFVQLTGRDNYTTFVLPHQRMFPRRRALPHQACSRCLTDPPSEPQLLF